MKKIFITFAAGLVLAAAVWAEPDVYVSGSRSGVACYWKNGMRTALSDGRTRAAAKAIAVSGADVYVAGLERNAAGNAACYWKNGVKTELTDGRQPAIAEAVVVSGPGVYVAGTEIFAGGGACYWKKGVKTALGGGKTYAYAHGIAFGGD